VPDNHKTSCGCGVCVQRRSAEAHRAAAAGLEQTRRDAAWMQVMGAGGPDAVLALARQHGDPGRAVRLLQEGGFDVAGITSRWRADGLRQASAGQSATAGLWASSPDHDSRVVQALLRGASDAELSTIRQQVKAEYDGKAFERQRRQDEYYGRTGAQAVSRGPRPMPSMPPMGFAAQDERGVPVQVSRTVPGSGGPPEGAVHQPAEGSA